MLGDRYPADGEPRLCQGAPLATASQCFPSTRRLLELFRIWTWRIPVRLETQTRMSLIDEGTRHPRPSYAGGLVHDEWVEA